MRNHDDHRAAWAAHRRARRDTQIALVGFYICVGFVLFLTCCHS